MPPNSEIEKLERRWKDNPKGTVFAPYAEVLRKNADYELAREVLRQGLELHPDHIPGNIVLGRCCLDLGEDGVAETAFSHVLELDAENVIALKALAEITERQGRLAEAHSWLTRLIAVDPSNDEARDQLARVNQTQESASSEVAAAAATSPAAVTEVIEPPVVRGEPRIEPPRVETGAGEIADTGERPAVAAPAADYAAAAEQALDDFLTPPVAEAPAPPRSWATPPDEAATVPMIPVQRPEPEPVAGLEASGFDLSDIEDEELDRLADVEVHEPFSPPPPVEASQEGSMPFSIGVEEPEAIELRPSGSTEFQAPDDSEALLHLASGERSEFQVPDAAQELTVSESAGSEYQTPSGAEELLRSTQAAREAEVEPEEAMAPAAGGPEDEAVEPDLELLAAMPTQEMATSPPIPAVPAATETEAPSWMFDEEAAAAAEEIEEPAPTAEPAEAEPETVAMEEEAAAEFEAEAPAPEAPTAARSTAGLKLIFPDESGEEEPPRRRITEEVARPLMAAEAEPEPAVMDPAPVMTETMAELYARQGHLAEAIRVYRALAERQPNDARLRLRIEELEARGASAAPRRMTYVAVETGGESVESFFRALAEARPGGPGPERHPDEDAGGAPTRPARDPLSLSAIFGEEPASGGSASSPTSGPGGTPRSPAGPDAFSFDQFFGGPGAGTTPGGPSSARPPNASDEDLDQFQHWLKSLKR